MGIPNLTTPEGRLPQPLIPGGSGAATPTQRRPGNSGRSLAQRTTFPPNPQAQVGTAGGISIIRSGLGSRLGEARPAPFLPARSRRSSGRASRGRDRESRRQRSPISRQRHGPATRWPRSARSLPAGPGATAPELYPGRGNTEASDGPRGRAAHLAAGIRTPTPGTPQARPPPTHRAKPKLKSPRRRRFSDSANHCFP